MWAFALDYLPVTGPNLSGKLIGPYQLLTGSIKPVAFLNPRIHGDRPFLPMDSKNGGLNLIVSLLVSVQGCLQWDYRNDIFAFFFSTTVTHRFVMRLNGMLIDLPFAGECSSYMKKRRGRETATLQTRNQPECLQNKAMKKYSMTLKQVLLQWMIKLSCRISYKANVAR